MLFQLDQELVKQNMDKNENDKFATFPDVFKSVIETKIIKGNL